MSVCGETSESSEMVASEAIKRRANLAFLISSGVALLLLLSVMQVRSNLCLSVALNNKCGFKPPLDTSGVGLPRTGLCENARRGGIPGELHAK